MKLLTCVAACVMSVGLLGSAIAAENPTGTWTWKVMGRPGADGGAAREREMKLKLKLDGDKLTGSVPGRDGMETAIEEGSFKDDEVSFKITRGTGDRKFTSTYKGKVSGDKITGTITGSREGSKPREWTATKAKE